MIDFDKIKLLIFDADDTLWDCQTHFDRVMNHAADILKPYVEKSETERLLYETERSNMPLMGYGTKAFTISLMENAIKVSQMKAKPQELLEILNLGKDLLRMPATPLEGVVETLNNIKQTGKYIMTMFTKGELLDQEGKIERSGLGKFFDDIVIVSDKTDDEYIDICRKNAVHPEEMLTIGNSFRSDVAPALRIGASAIYIPFHTTWALEHTETFEHERLMTVERFDSIQDLLVTKL